MAKSTVDGFNSILNNGNGFDESALVDPTNYPAVRDRFFTGVMSALQDLQPVSNDRHTLRFSDIDWGDSKGYGPKDVTQSLGKGRTLHRSVKGRVELVDNETGDVVSKSGKRTLANVPYFTDDGTFLLDGTEMTVSRQPRPMPGVYTQYRDDGSLSTKFRVTKGGGFDINMVPETGEFRLKFRNRHVPLYPVLKSMGVPDETLKQSWGDLYDVNRRSHMRAGAETWMKEQADKGLQYLEKNPDLIETSEEESEYSRGLRAWFANKGLLPQTTQRTLGTPYDKVTPETMIAAASNVSRVYKGERGQDNQDSLEFQEIWSPEDRVAEAMRKDMGGRMRQMLWKASGSGDVSKLPTAPLNPYIYDLFINSGSQQVLEQPNPLDMYNQATRLSWMGEGGITDAQGAPMSTRSIQPSYAGFIDLSRTPESYRTGLDMYLAHGVKLGPDKKLYRQMLDAKTKKPQWVDMHTASREMVGFPSFYGDAKNKKYVYAMDNEGITIVPREEVKYVLPKADDMSSDLGSLVPMKSGVKGMRQLMGCLDADTDLIIRREGVGIFNTKAENYQWQTGDETVSCADDMSMTWEEIRGVRNNDLPMKRVKVLFENGSTLTTTVNHTWVVESAGGSPVKKLAINLEKGMRVPSAPGPFDELQGPAVWKAITEIRQKAPSEKSTYDLDLGGKTFMCANGVFVHNSKFVTHALSLNEPEVPLVRTKLPSGQDIAEKLGRYAGARFSPEAGVVDSVDSEGISIKGDDGKISKIPLYDMRPYARKTYISNKPLVKPGDRVEEDQILASSDYTDEQGKLAVMKNLRVAYMPFGTTFEDGVPISESAAEKMKSRLMLNPRFETDDQTLLDGKKFRQQFPRKYTPEQYAKIGDDGVVKKGETLEYGDPVYLGLANREASEATLGRALLTDASETWTHHAPGKVIRTAVTDDGAVSANIVTEESLAEGDKLSIPFGGKGVAVIYPDEEMPKDEEGNPVEVILNPHGVSSRTNPSQLSAAALGKIALKRGEPYLVPGFSEDSLTEYAADELKKHGLKAKENLIDPSTGREIPQVSTGILPFYRMQQLSEGKGKGRGVGQGYTQEGTPVKGGEHGAKHYGPAEYRSLLTHGAHKVLADLKLINSQRNDDFWSKLKSGQTPSIPDTPEPYNRMRAMIRASGVDLRESGDGDIIYAMTNSRAKQLSGDRKLKNPSTYDVSMRPLKGGLFDPELTSGKFSYIELPEPMLNPVMEDAFRSIFGVTQNGMLDLVAGRSDKTLKQKLASLNVDEELKSARREIRKGKGDRRDKAFKKHSYLQAMKENGVEPSDFLMDRLPVLPQEFRPITKMKDIHLVSDPNRMYRDLMFRIEDFSEVSKDMPEMEPDAREAVYKSMAATVGTRKTDSPKLEQAKVGGILQQFLGKASPKNSSVQRRVIGSDIDLYGLGVIAPDHKLQLDEVGVPEDQAWEMYAPFATRSLVKKGLPPQKAVQEVQQKTEKARAAMIESMNERPVILNRAPTLHRFGVMAFRPKLVKGAAIHINPWVAGPYNADFDGNCVDFDTEIDLTVSISALQYSELGGQWLSVLNQRYSEMLSPNEEVDLRSGTIRIGEFPAVGPSVKDKNGADVYEVPEGVYITTCDSEGRGRQCAITKFTVERDCPCVEVATARKRKVIVSDNESMAVFDPEEGEMVKKTPMGSKGMLVPVVRQEPVTGNEYNYDIGWWYGSLLADGWVTENKKTVGYAKLSEEKREHFAKVARREIHDNFVVRGPYFRGEGEGGGWGKGAKIHLNGDLAPNVLDIYDGEGRGALHKRIPGELLANGSYDCMLGLFAGLLDGDCSIKWNNSVKKKRLHVAFNTSSASLVSSLRRLGRKLGIRMSVTTIPARNNSQESYVVNPSISDLYYSGVLDKLTLVDKEKERMFKEFTAGPAVKDDTDYVAVDFESIEKISRAMLGLKEMALYTSVRNGLRREGSVVRATLKRALDLMDEGLFDENLKRVKQRCDDRSVVWDSVKTVEDAGSRDVFDFEIPETKVFAINNGLVVYDTMSMTVPVTRPAVDEAYAKMLPSKLLLDDKSGDPNFVPGHEFLHGLNLLSRPPEGGDKPFQVKRGEDMIKTLREAFASGQVNLDTPVAES